MPRVAQHKKNKVGTFRCDRCPDPIVAGQEFYSWAFRYGGKHYQHASHGSPKPSQLTQSKMSGAYAAVEAAQDALAVADNVEDMKSALETCAEEIGNVRDEYQESLDNMISQEGSIAQEVQEKIDALESFADELQGVDLEEFDEEEPEEPSEEPADKESDEYTEWSKAHDEWQTEHEEWDQKQSDHLEEQRTAADEALGNLSI